MTALTKIFIQLIQNPFCILSVRFYKEPL